MVIVGGDTYDVANSISFGCKLVVLSKMIPYTCTLVIGSLVFG